jgi:20S proteasome subunit beta 6
VLALVVDSFTSATERHIEVGDGLEIFIVLAKGRDPEGLEGTQEVTSTSGGERVFIVQRDLKKD